MTARIPYDILTPELKVKIKKHLTFTPKIIENKYNQDQDYHSIDLYEKIGNHFHLPYSYAAGLFQIIPNKDHPFRKVKLEFTGSLRKNQLGPEAEAWTQLQKKGTTLVGLYPGFGKTVIGASLAVRTGLLTVVLFTRKILMTQWKNTFNNFTDAITWSVGEERQPDGYNVILCMKDRWDKLDKNLREKVGTLIIDEAHLFCTPTGAAALLAFQPYYIVAETATLERDDELHHMILSIVGNDGVYRTTTKEFRVIKHSTRIKPERKKNRQGGTDWIALERTIAMNPERNQQALEIVQLNKNFKILILTKLVDHVKELEKLFKAKELDVDSFYGTKKKYRDSRILIGTISKMGTGFDQASSCADFSGENFNLLLLMCSIKKYAQLEQNVGRAFRSDFPTVVHFVDDDSIITSHWYICRKWYLQRGANMGDKR